MKIAAIPAAMFASALILGACSSSEPPPVETAYTRDVPLQQSGDVGGRAGMIYRHPNVNLRQYTRLIVEPVEIYRGEDGNFGDATETQKQAMAEYMRAEIIRELGPRAATTPGPGVARLKLTLAGLEGNTPVVATASRIIPLGLVANVTQQARGAPGAFTGSVTYSGELVDSQTNAPLVVFIQKRSPDAMDIPATFTSEDAQRAAIRSAAEGLRKRMDQLQTMSGAP